MKLSYVLQMRDFLILFVSGFIVALIYTILSTPDFIKKKIAIKIPLDLVSTLLIAITFIILVNYVNMGEFRLFLLIAYLLGIILELLTLGKIFAKGYKWVYNKLVILNKNLKESKLGKVLFK